MRRAHLPPLRRFLRALPWVVSIGALAWSAVGVGWNRFLYTVYRGHQINALVFTADSRFLVGGGYFHLPGGEIGEVHLWNVQTGKCLWTATQNDRVLALAVSPNGKQIATISQVADDKGWFLNQGMTGPYRYVISLRSSTGGRKQSEFCDVFSLAQTHGIIWSPDSQIVGVVHQDGVALYRRAPDGNYRPATKHIVRPRGGTTWAVFAQSGELITTCDANENRYPAVNGSVDVWNARTGVWLRSLEQPENTRFEADLSPDGKRLVTLARDKSRVTVWNVQTGQKLARRYPRTISGEHLFHPQFFKKDNGGESEVDVFVTIASEIRYSTRTWYWASRSKILTPMTASGAVNEHQIISPDGEWWATIGLFAADKCLIHIYDAQTRREVPTEGTREW